MDDQQSWNLGIARISDLLENLPKDVRRPFALHLARYRQIKELLAATVSEYDSATVCRDCKGQCCLNGKYRMSVFDAMALLIEPFQLSVNFAKKPLCPYGAEDGCLLEPANRPADCILFLCDALDQMLSPQARGQLSEQEHELRECILCVSALINEPMGKPLLLWAEKLNC